MATTKQRPSILVIVGPTASGKSALAHWLAIKYDGEIISADSRAVYKGMDIGTAKPSKKEQRQVRYWGLDLIEPGEKFSVADYQKYAQAKIADISNRDKLPILVGGSGLYIDAVLFNYSFVPNKTTNPLNPRHRLSGSYVGNSKPSDGALVVGLLPQVDQQRDNISKRTKDMFTRGVVNETKMLVLKYGQERLLATHGIVYRVCLGYLNGEYDLNSAKELNMTADWQYARRQRTWFKRNKDIKWFENSSSAQRYIEAVLNT